ncbi:MAG: response regulator [Chitinivibrionales bacterium]|nr:response regulator [Chitinivibrionales bacterium]
MPRHLLIVDNDDQLRRSLTLTFQMEKFSVLPAKTGNEALGLLTAYRLDGIVIDALVTELSLDDMPGFNLIKKIHAIDCTIPIIVMSGQSTKQMLIDLLRMGCCDFLEKPVEREVIVKSIHAAIASHERKINSKFTPQVAAHAA